ncbi:antitoxin VapB family protein [Candidatus Nanohalobium constans]|uniref:Putative antitoxin LC1Nh_0923 n=1 Tax=Candidatus Nanohalobium constans TaxID=2565781 RepID=A0A5Q0UIN7_9ARCH|nr:antitoxin VapB family protein [Candidatus Nanohalobium constans]QGA80805.1 putative antitoxin, CopG family [Candidatus Nanohalobium constans]
MGSKTITIREEVYQKLSRIKEDKSFSELLEELVSEKEVDLMGSFGAWDEEEAEDVRDKTKNFREDFDSDFSEKMES